MDLPEKILREKLAELEHEQWMEWSKYLSEKELLSIERLKHWQNLWKPYNELPESEKDQDRIWADKVLAIYIEDQKGWKQKIEFLEACIKALKDGIKVRNKGEEERKQKLKRMLNAEIENYKTATQAHEPVLQAYANGRRKLLRELLEE